MAPVAKVGLVSNVVKAGFSKVLVKQEGLLSFCYLENYFVKP